MSEPNRDELVGILKDLQQKVNTVVEKTNANANNGVVEATNSAEIETPVEEASAEPVAVDTVMGGGRRKKQRRTKKQCGGRKSRKGRKTKARKTKGRSRKH